MLKSIARTLPVVLVAWPLLASVVAIALAGKPDHRRRWVLLAMAAQLVLAAAAFVTALPGEPVETADDWVRLRLGLDWAFRLDVPRTLLLLPALLGVTALARRVGASVRLWAMLPVMGGLSAVLLGVDAGVQALAAVGIVVACEVARRFQIRRRWLVLRCVGAFALLAGVSAMAGIHYRRTGYLSFLSADLAWMHYGRAQAWLCAILTGGLVLRLGGAVLPFTGGSGERMAYAPSTDAPPAEMPRPMPEVSQPGPWLALAVTIELAVALGVGLSLLERMFAGPWDVFAAVSSEIPAQKAGIPFPAVFLLVCGVTEAWRLARDKAQRPTVEFIMTWILLSLLSDSNEANGSGRVADTGMLVSVSMHLSALLAMGAVLMARDYTHVDRGAAVCVALGWLTLTGTPPLGAWPLGVLPGWRIGVYWVGGGLWWVPALAAVAFIGGLLLSFSLRQVRRVISGEPAESLDPMQMRVPLGQGERLLLAGMVTASVILGIWPALGL